MWPRGLAAAWHAIYKRVCATLQAKSNAAEEQRPSRNFDELQHDSEDFRNNPAAPKVQVRAGGGHDL